MKKILVLYLGITFLGATTFAREDSDEFVGPFSNWLDVKRDFHAVGNGSTDDTRNIQNALDSLPNNIASRVLYFPAGTYIISSTLKLTKAKCIGVFGEDPVTTIIKWSGASSDSAMLATWSVSNARFGRITFDGSSNTKMRGIWHQWLGYSGGTNNYFPSYVEDFDMVFHHLRTGIEGGAIVTGGQNTACETSIRRCTFRNCTYAGVRVNDWNTVDFWVRQCLFEDNYYGVAGDIGSVCVYNNVFKRSGIDIKSMGSEGFAARFNYSSGSSKFYNNGGGATFQGNVIVNPTNVPVISYSYGPMTLLDNVIVSANAKVISWSPTDAYNAPVSVGNTFTTATPWGGTALDSLAYRVHSIDDVITTVGTVNPVEPLLPTVPHRFTGPIIEVSAFTGAAIQKAVDSAVANYNGQRPVVHLKKGEYTVSSFILVPPSDVRIVGDGASNSLGDASTFNTQLKWTGLTSSYVIYILGADANGKKSKVQLKDFSINGTASAGVYIPKANNSGSRVFLDRCYTINTSSYAVFGDGLNGTVIEGWDCLLSAKDSSTIVISGIGDTINNPPNAVFYGGTGGNVGDTISPVFDIRNNANLMIQDWWYENGGRRTPIFKLTSASSGCLTLNAGKNQYHTQAAKGGPSMNPTHTVKGFKGKCTVIGMGSWAATKIVVDGTEPLQNVMFMGNNFGFQDTVQSRAFITNPSATTYFLASWNSGNNIGVPWELGNPSNAWKLSMLDQVRTQKADPFIDSLPGQLDVRLYRIMVENTKYGIQIKGGLPIIVGVHPALQMNSAIVFTKVLKVMPGSRVILPEQAKQVALFDVKGRMLYQASLMTSGLRKIAEQHLNTMKCSSVTVMKVW